MEDLFGEGKAVFIKTDYGETAERFMRFLKVKELPEFYRINEIKDERERTLAFIAMIKEKVTGEIDSLPANDVRDAFIDMNFGSPAERDKKKVGAEDFLPVHNLASAIGFLVSQGHRLSDIMEYPLPRFRLYGDTASDRVYGKKEKPKKMDPLDAFIKLGFPIKRKPKNG
jgi:hypothetical protein